MPIEHDVEFLERVPMLRLIGRAGLRIVAIGAEQRLAFVQFEDTRGSVDAVRAFLQPGQTSHSEPSAVGFELGFAFLSPFGEGGLVGAILRPSGDGEQDSEITEHLLRL